LVRDDLIETVAYHQLECYERALQWARTEGFIPAPETSHAIAATVDEALKAKEEGKEKVILMNWSGHGLMDLKGYEAYLAGELTDYEYPQEEIERSLEVLKEYPKP
ncbi:MAG: TrpB-like pyridoxal-phosphate dependent enzyme, partial [Lentisphaeria bacterium]|nr:TrpB-like pyridoxal-phosphate dependent enzyme [Lentisphaeria bacterium]